MEEKTYSFAEFMEIVYRLRGEGGCPWDRAQTHDSLKKYLLEESEEVLDGIDEYEKSGDSDNLCEELGDVLYQVALHSAIAREEGAFTIEDVISGIAAKMVRRHPKVFGSGQESMSWDEIKAEERRIKSQKGNK